MSRFTSAAAKESFLESIKRNVRERQIYCGEVVAEVLPGPREDPLPKRKVFAVATETAASNGLDGVSFFAGDPDRFHSYLSHNWPKIRRVMADDLGVHVEFGHGIPGIRRAGKVGLRKTAAWSADQVGTMADRHNESVESARDIVALPGIQYKLLLPGS